MKNIILANRYAKALFAVAQESDSFDEYSKILKEVATVIQAQPEVQDGLTNRLYPVDVRVKVMDHIVGAVGATGVVKNFLTLATQTLAEVGHAAQLKPCHAAPIFTLYL